MSAAIQLWQKAESVDDALRIASRTRVTHLELSRTKDRDFLRLVECPDLTHLAMISCRYAADLRCLEKTRLIDLFLMDVPALRDLEWITGMNSLRSVGLCGSVSKVIHGKHGGTIRSIRPLIALPDLRSIQLGGVRIESEGLLPLVELRSLTDLRFGRKVFSPEEVDAFSALRPDVRIQK